MLDIVDLLLDELGGPLLVIARKHLRKEVKKSVGDIHREYAHRGIHFFYTENRQVLINCYIVCYCARLWGLQALCTHRLAGTWLGFYLSAKGPLMITVYA